MKSTFILLLALLFMPLQTDAASTSISVHNAHKPPFNGSTNKLFTPLGKQEQQALSKASPIEESGYDKESIERVSWVKVNTAEIDALRSYAKDILAQAENNPDLKLISYRNYAGNNHTLRIKKHLDFPIDINFNFFEDIEFDELYLGEITKTTLPSGELHYALVLKQSNASLRAVYVELKDKLTAYTSYADFYVRLEQIGKHNFRVNMQKIPKLIEGEIKTPIKKPQHGAASGIQPQYRMEGELTRLNATTRIIDVLVLFDNHTNQSFAKSSTVNPGIGIINSLLTNSGINALVNIIAFDKLPTPLCGGGDSACYISYERHLREITASEEMINLRLKHGADVAVVIRSTRYGDMSFETAGIANLTDPNDPFQADKTYALVHATSGENTFAHEVAHVLGAGHSAFNSDPGKAPAVALLGFYEDKKNLPYHKDAVKTFMTYEHICNSELHKVNLNNPGKSLQKCSEVDQFSGPVQHTVPWTNLPVMLGSNSIANRHRVDDVTYRAQGWNKEIINHKPEPAINFVNVPLITGLQHCFNAVGSKDPDGDRLVRFYWFIMKDGNYTKLKEAEYATKESTFCWTPTHAQRGNYRVLLSVSDHKGAAQVVGKGLFIVYDPNYISAPQLYLHKVGSSSITLSWSQPTKGSVGYYDIYKRMDNGSFFNIGLSWDRMEDVSLGSLSQGDNYFRVRGCTYFDGCGAWSNTLHYRPGTTKVSAEVTH